MTLHGTPPHPKDLRLIRVCCLPSQSPQHSNFIIFSSSLVLLKRSSDKVLFTATVYAHGKGLSQIRQAQHRLQHPVFLLYNTCIVLNISCSSRIPQRHRLTTKSSSLLISYYQAPTRGASAKSKFVTTNPKHPSSEANPLTVHTLRLQADTGSEKATSQVIWGVARAGRQCICQIRHGHGHLSSSAWFKLPSCLVLKRE